MLEVAAIVRRQNFKSNLLTGLAVLNLLLLQNLDFDFEKCCSVSLSPVNVYVCLVCGKYFQVRTSAKG